MRYFEAEIEGASREALQDFQWKALKQLLDHSYANSSFYRETFDAAGITPDDINSLEDFQAKVPTSDKLGFLEDQDLAPPYGRRLAIPEQDLRQVFLTSGTSGLGQEVHAYSESDMSGALDGWARSLRWAGVDPGDVAFLMVPIGVTAGPVSLLASFQRYGLKTFAVGQMDGRERLSIMQRFSPSYIATGPVYLRRLTQICEEEGIDPRVAFPDLKNIKLGTFGYEIDWVKEMEEIWGARISDTYASTQCGAGIATSCEAGLYRPDGGRGMLHFPEHRVLAEIVDPATGKNAEEDQEGEVILTPLTRYGMPVIRFRTGDRVIRKSHRQCTCGRPFDGIEAGTVSRYDSMMKIRGMNLWPEAVDAVVFAHKEIEEYNGRVLISDIGREVVKINAKFKDQDLSTEAKAAVLESIESKVKQQTGVTVRASEAAADEFESFTYKERRWRDLRALN